MHVLLEHDKILNKNRVIFVKEQVLNALKNIHKSLEPIEISNLLNFKTTGEYQDLCDINPHRFR